MARARCMNEDDCDREVWELRKPPSEYRRGPTCPDCGTTRVVNAETGEPFQPQAGSQPAQRPAQPSQQPPTQQPSQQPPPQQQAQPPAQQQPQQAQQLPAQQQEGLGLQAGAVAGEALLASQSADPTRAAQGRADLFEMVAGVAGQMAQKTRDQAEQRRHNAEAYSEDEGYVKPPQDFARCYYCEEAITDMPASGIFNCPHCGRALSAD